VGRCDALEVDGNGPGSILTPGFDVSGAESVDFATMEFDKKIKCNKVG
jgi:hypothetical protein